MGRNIFIDTTSPQHFSKSRGAQIHSHLTPTPLQRRRAQIHSHNVFRSFRKTLVYQYYFSFSFDPWAHPTPRHCEKLRGCEARGNLPQFCGNLYNKSRERARNNEAEREFVGHELGTSPQPLSKRRGAQNPTQNVFRSFRKPLIKQ